MPGNGPVVAPKNFGQALVTLARVGPERRHVDERPESKHTVVEKVRVGMEPQAEGVVGAARSARPAARAVHKSDPAGGGAHLVAVRGAGCGPRGLVLSRARPEHAQLLAVAHEPNDRTPVQPRGEVETPFPWQGGALAGNRPWHPPTVDVYEGEYRAEAAARRGQVRRKERSCFRAIARSPATLGEAVAAVWRARVDAVMRGRAREKQRVCGRVGSGAQLSAERRVAVHGVPQCIPMAGQPVREPGGGRRERRRPRRRRP